MEQWLRQLDPLPLKFQRVVCRRKEETNHITQAEWKKELERGRGSSTHGFSMVYLIGGWGKEGGKWRLIKYQSEVVMSQESPREHNRNYCRRCYGLHISRQLLEGNKEIENTVTWLPPNGYLDLCSLTLVTKKEIGLQPD